MCAAVECPAELSVPSASNTGLQREDSAPRLPSAVRHSKHHSQPEAPEIAPFLSPLVQDYERRASRSPRSSGRKEHRRSDGGDPESRTAAAGLQSSPAGGERVRVHHRLSEADAETILAQTRLARRSLPPERAASAAAGALLGPSSGTSSPPPPLHGNSKDETIAHLASQVRALRAQCDALRSLAAAPRDSVLIPPSYRAETLEKEVATLRARVAFLEDAASQESALGLLDDPASPRGDFAPRICLSASTSLTDVIGGVTSRLAPPVGAKKRWSLFRPSSSDKEKEANDLRQTPLSASPVKNELVVAQPRQSALQLEKTFKREVDAQLSRADAFLRRCQSALNSGEKLDEALESPLIELWKAVVAQGPVPLDRQQALLEVQNKAMEISRKWSLVNDCMTTASQFANQVSSALP
eukprot:m51a1_g3389 hypothetical protein (413) ;mRNA; f:511435-512801